MHYLHTGMEPTLVAAASTSSKMLPEARHLDIPWKELYRRTITKTTCTNTPLGLESSLSARDSYILSLHARTKHAITPRGSRGRSLLPTKSFSLPPAATVRFSSHTAAGPRGITKRFKKQGQVLRLQKAVLMKNWFEAAARDYDARGDTPSAEKQRKNAKLPQKYIDKVAEQDDPISWTFPPNRLNAKRRDCLPMQKSTLASVSF